MRFDYFRSTRFKMLAGHVLYRILVLLGIDRHQAVTRGGIRYCLDLAEGIDLSIFVFGSFQPHVSLNPFLQLSGDAVIIDVGANCGTVTLALARRYPQARVYTFEPTSYAYERLRGNITLNPGLAPRIMACQYFVSDEQGAAGQSTCYASWRVDSLSGDRHPVHLGIAKDGAAECVSIDAFVAGERLQRVDLVKIDTDGNELAVLRGMADCLARFRPAVIFELSTYLLRENRESFDLYEELFRAAGYDLFRAHDHRPVCATNVDQLVPRAGSIDILALPRQTRGHG